MEARASYGHKKLCVAKIMVSEVMLAMLAIGRYYAPGLRRPQSWKENGGQWSETKNRGERSAFQYQRHKPEGRGKVSCTQPADTKRLLLRSVGPAQENFTPDYGPRQDCGLVVVGFEKLSPDHHHSWRSWLHALLAPDLLASLP